MGLSLAAVALAIISDRQQIFNTLFVIRVAVENLRVAFEKPTCVHRPMVFLRLFFRATLIVVFRVHSAIFSGGRKGYLVLRVSLLRFSEAAMS